MADDKPKLSKEEIAARSAERIAGMLERCERDMGAPCSHGCTRGCARRALAAKASKARVARRKAKAKALKAGFERQDAAALAADKARLAEIRFTERARKSADKAVERFKVQVLYLCGLSTDEITRTIYGASKGGRGSINRLITTTGLAKLRGTPAGTARMVELADKPPHGFAGFAEHHAFRAMGKGFKGMHAEIERLRAIAPELVIEKTMLRGQGEQIRNCGASALQVAARGGAIQEWNLQAGLKLHGLFWNVSGGGIGTLDYTKDIVDGGGGDRDIGMIMGVDAARAMGAAKEKVLEAFEIDGTSAWRWAIIDHVVLQDRPLKDYPLPAGMTSSSALFLNDALLPLAIAFMTAPAGVGMKQPTSEERARHGLSVAMRAAREIRTWANGVEPRPEDQ